MIFYFKDQIYSDHSIQAHLRLLLSESVSAKKSSVELSLGISQNFQKFQKLSIVLRMKFKYLEAFKSTCLNQISRFEPDFRGNSHSNRDFEFTSNFGSKQPTLSISKEKIEDMSVWISFDALVWRTKFVQKKPSKIYQRRDLMITKTVLFGKSGKSEQKTFPEGDSFVGDFKLVPIFGCWWHLFDLGAWR